MILLLALLVLIFALFGGFVVHPLLFLLVLLAVLIAVGGYRYP